VRSREQDHPPHAIASSAKHAQRKKPEAVEYEQPIVSDATAQGPPLEGIALGHEDGQDGSAASSGVTA
jgi:hypothetical protein